MLSIPDMALLGAAALLLFGPDQLPKVVRKVGQFTREVQNTSQSFIREMERAADVHDHPISVEPVSMEQHGAEPYEPFTFDEHETPHVDHIPLATEKLAEPRPSIAQEEADTTAMHAIEPVPEIESIPRIEPIPRTES